MKRYLKQTPFLSSLEALLLILETKEVSWAKQRNEVANSPPDSTTLLGFDGLEKSNCQPHDNDGFPSSRS